MNLYGLDILKLSVATAVLMATVSSVSADTSSQFARCKAEVKCRYGEGTRVRMYGTKSYRGVDTLKLKVTPEGDSSMTLQCSSDIESEERVVLKDKNGELLGANYG